MICISGGFSISMLVYWMLPPLFGTPSHGVSSCVNLEGGLLLSVAIDGGISIYIAITQQTSNLLQSITD